MIIDGRQIYLEMLLPAQINGNQVYDHRIFIVSYELFFHAFLVLNSAT